MAASDWSWFRADHLCASDVIGLAMFDGTAARHDATSVDGRDTLQGSVFSYADKLRGAVSAVDDIILEHLMDLDEVVDATGVRQLGATDLPEIPMEDVQPISTPGASPRVAEMFLRIFHRFSLRGFIRGGHIHHGDC